MCIEVGEVGKVKVKIKVNHKMINNTQGDSNTILAIILLVKKIL